MFSFNAIDSPTDYVSNNGNKKTRRKIVESLLMPKKKKEKTNVMPNYKTKIYKKKMGKSIWLAFCIDDRSNIQSLK